MSDTTATPATPQSAASTAGDAGPSLADEISMLMGDFGSVSDGAADADESPAAESSSAAGAPPAAAPDAATDPATVTGSGAPSQDALAGAPPADATAATSPSTQTPDDDPLRDAKPLDYTVDGQSRTFEGITVLANHQGAIISPEHLTQVQQRLSERDHLYEQAKASYERSKAVEDRYAALDKLVSWQAKGADGKDVMLTGREAVEAQRVAMAHLAAERNALLEIVHSPEKMAALLVSTEQADGSFKITHNQQAWENAQLRIQAAQRTLADRVRAHLESVVPRGAFQPMPQAQPEMYTPEQVAQQAPAAVDGVLASLNIADLTAEDKAFLVQAIVPYIRATTDEDRRTTPGAGPMIVDRRFVPIVERLRAVRSEAKQSATAASKAAEENARRLAAAVPPRAPAPTTRPAAPAATTAAERAREQEARDADAWNQRTRAIAAMI